VILGIDPGLSGGLAILSGSHIELLETIPTETKGGFIKRQVDAQKLSNILREKNRLVNSYGKDL